MTPAQIVEIMEPLIQEAERNGWWFRSHYQQLWFSPAELREAMKAGRFVWGPENWERVDPRIMLWEIGKRIERDNEAYNRAVDRLRAGGVKI